MNTDPICYNGRVPRRCDNSPGRGHPRLDGGNVTHATRTTDPDARFWAKVDADHPLGCWLWTAALDPSGYGRFQLGRGIGTTLAHRHAYKLLRGELPDDLTLDHLCRVHNCVNPDHLEAVTNAENVLRGYAPSSINARKTHCIRGHAFDAANTVITSQDKRQCRTCNRIRESKRDRRVSA